MIRLCVVMAFVFLCVGCGERRPETFPVSGKVVYRDGTFPQFGDIEFYNQELKLNAHGKIQKDGTFQVGTFDLADGAVAGRHKVIILQRTRNHLTVKIEGQINHDHGDLVDQRYYDYRTSKLVAEIKPIEMNHIELEVRKMPKKEQADTD